MNPISGALYLRANALWVAGAAALGWRAKAELWARCDHTA